MPAMRVSFRFSRTRREGHLGSRKRTSPPPQASACLKGCSLCPLVKLSCALPSSLLLPLLQPHPSHTPLRCSPPASSVPARPRVPAASHSSCPLRCSVRARSPSARFAPPLHHCITPALLANPSSKSCGRPLTTSLKCRSLPTTPMRYLP